MKHLLIMRHSKSDQGETGMTDFERPLNDRGKADAVEMGKRLLKKQFKPDLIVSSPARRALKTSKIVAGIIEITEGKILEVPGIYDASLEELMHVIRNLEPNKNHVMMVGHNPAFTGLVGYIGDSFIENLPTSGMALMRLNILSWKQVTKNCGTLEWFDYPKRDTNR